MTEAIANVLAARYASRAMAAVWSPERRVVLERRLWLAVLRAQRRLGLDVPDGVIEAYEAVVDRVDLSSIQAREAVTRHDVKARIEEFCALAGHQHIHRGMTSRDLTENVEQLQVRESLELIRAGLAAVIGGLADRAERHASQAMVARTHNVAAQATTLGKRFADAAEESMLGCERIDELLARYPLRGVKGAVGTRVDQLDWAAEAAEDEPERPAEAGDEIGRTAGAAAVDELEREVADYLGFDRVLDACGQVYPRSLDLDVVAALVQAVCGPASLAVTIRLMAGHELVSEGFRPGQVGSSAMPHKMNARSCERIGALRTVLDGHLTMAAGLAGRQWNEGDVTCSAVRRVMLPRRLLHGRRAAPHRAGRASGDGGLRRLRRVRARSAPSRFGHCSPARRSGLGRRRPGGRPRAGLRTRPGRGPGPARGHNCRLGRQAGRRRPGPIGPRRLRGSAGRARVAGRLGRGSSGQGGCPGEGRDGPLPGSSEPHL